MNLLSFIALTVILFQFCGNTVAESIEEAKAKNHAAFMKSQSSESSALAKSRARKEALMGSGKVTKSKVTVPNMPPSIQALSKTSTG
jgi:hypothetical protein